MVMVVEWWFLEFKMIIEDVGNVDLGLKIFEFLGGL